MSIAKNASYNLIGSLIPLVVSLVTVPLYLHAIGLERYGVLALCWTLLGYMGFLNLGLGPSVAQKMATLRKTDGAERESVFWTSLWVSLAMGLVAGLVVYGAADAYFTRMKDLPVGLSREIADARAWLAAIIPVILLSSVLTGALQGHERFLAINVITSSMSILMSVAPLAVAYVFGPHLSGLLAAALAVRVGSLLALYLMCRSTIPIRQVRRLELSHVRNLLTFGGWVTASAVMAPLLVTFDRFVIGAMLGAAAVSIYTIPHNLVGRLFVIPQALSNALFPRFAYAERRQGEQLLANSVAALASIQTPIFVFAIAALGPFLDLWIGPELSRHSAPIAYVLATGAWANGLARLPYAFLQGTGRPDLITKLLLAYLIPYAVLLYVGLSELGLMAAPLVWSLKSTLDPLFLFVLARQARENLPTLVPPALFVYSAAGIALAVPDDSLWKWVALTLLFLGATGQAAVKMPVEMRRRISGLLVALRARYSN